jgi:hypothetical protein
LVFSDPARPLEGEQPRAVGLRSHAEAIAAIDLCVVPTARFERLFAFVSIGHGRRQLL